MILHNEAEHKSLKKDEFLIQQDDLNFIWKTSQFLQSRNWIETQMFEQSELIIW